MCGLAVQCSRGYTDRKKKIIREWNKTNSSPRPAETLTSADPLRPAAYMVRNLGRRGGVTVLTPFYRLAMNYRTSPTIPMQL